MKEMRLTQWKLNVFLEPPILQNQGLTGCSFLISFYESIKNYCL